MDPYRYQIGIFSDIFLFKHQRNTFLLAINKKKRWENKKNVKKRVFYFKIKKT